LTAENQDNRNAWAKHPGFNSAFNKTFIKRPQIAPNHRRAKAKHMRFQDASLMLKPRDPCPVCGAVASVAVLASVLGTALLLQARLALAPLTSLALRLVINGLDRANATQKQLIRAHAQTFADWCAEVRDLADERWPEVSDEAPTLYAVWGSDATPQQALHIMDLILPPARHGVRRGQL
jgi:hypothetical protein